MKFLFIILFFIAVNCYTQTITTTITKTDNDGLWEYFNKSDGIEDNSYRVEVYIKDYIVFHTKKEDFRYMFDYLPDDIKTKLINRKNIKM